MKAERSKVIIVHESVLGSIIKDTFTFFTFGLLLYANYNWFGNSGVALFFILIIALLWMGGRVSKDVHQFVSVDDSINYLKGVK